MKRIFSFILIVFTVCILASCGTKLELKGSVDQGDMDFNPKSSVGYVGDVMPFFDNNELNIYYLQDGRNTNLGFHPFAMMSTTDFISYKDYGVVIPFENDLYSPDLALGTGSVIKDKNGLYHCFYTGYNGNKSSGLPYFEKIQHATSTDKINWIKHPEHGFYGGQNDFRDPYVYYNTSDDTYYMLITTRANNSGVIKQYKSKDLISWTDNGIFFKNDSGSYNMECPTFLEYNGYYYLSYSEQGNHRVTHYRYKKNLSDEWIKPEVYYVDGEGLYAGRMEKAFGGLYMFGWCGTKDGKFDNVGFDWGGNLVTHKLIQMPNGELKPTIVDQIDDKLSTGVEYKLTNGDKLDTLKFEQSKAQSYVVEQLSNNITKIKFTINPTSLDGDCGISFGTIGPNVLSSLVLSFDFKKNTISYYNNAVNFQNYGSAQIAVPYKYTIDEVINVTIIINDSIITVYANDTIALTARIYEMVNNKFSFYGNNTSATIENIKFYE